MDYTTLGRTELKASVVGLGAGGPSRLGTRTGRSEEESIALVRRAYEMGINYFDTAEAYGTEEIVAAGLESLDRDDFILSTKKGAFKDGNPVSASEYREGVEESLKRLRTDFVDIFHIHGVRQEQVDHVCSELLPVLLDMKKEGKIRHLALSEHFGTDGDHQTLRTLVADGHWDVVMVGFNILNQTARETLFPITQREQIGTECMFAVRRAFSRPERLREILEELIERDEIEGSEIDLDNPLEFILDESDVGDLTEAAYRFCRHEPGLDVILTGTGNVDHLEQNVAALLKPPLPESLVTRLRRLFAGVASVTGG